MELQGIDHYGFLFVDFLVQMDNFGQESHPSFCQFSPRRCWQLGWILFLPGSRGATGAIRIVALVVKYLDRSKTNFSEGILQECFH